MNFFENLFEPKFGNYENLTNFDPVVWKWAIWGLYIGIVAAAIATAFIKGVLGKFPRALIDAGATSPENAKKLAEVNCNNFLFRFFMRHGYVLRNVVYCRGAGEDDNLTRIWAKIKIDFNSAAFYVPEEKRDAALSRFSTKGSGWMTVLIVAVVGLAAVAGVFKALPPILSYFNSVFGG